MDRRENRSTKVTKNTYNEIAKKSKGNCLSIPAKLEQTQEECAGTTL